MLYARRVPDGFLCLLLTPGVNQSALKMAVNLVARRIADQIAHAAPPAVNPPPPRGPKPRPPGVRVYRGALVKD